MDNLSKEKEEYLLSLLSDQNSATHVPFGFEFQADAGIFLLARYYDKIESVKIESTYQDIELKTNDNKFILSQAKSAENPKKHYNNEKAKLYDAFISLLKSDTTNVIENIYVTNLDDPLSSDENGEYFEKIVSYEYLSEKAKETIDSVITKLKDKITSDLSEENLSSKKKDFCEALLLKISKFDLNKMSFLSIPRYYGNDDRGVSIIREINNFITAKYQIPYESSYQISRSMYKKLHAIFMINNSIDNKSTYKTIDKTQFAWTAILVISEKDTVASMFYKLGVSFDEEDPILNVIQGYIGDFDSKLRIDDISCVLADYYNYKKNNKNDTSPYIEYVKSNYMKYTELFSYINDEEIRNYVTMLFIYKLCVNYKTIQSIKGSD